jgi:hypothetical protein
MIISVNLNSEELKAAAFIQSQFGGSRSAAIGYSLRFTQTLYEGGYSDLLKIKHKTQNTKKT